MANSCRSCVGDHVGSIDTEEMVHAGNFYTLPSTCTQQVPISLWMVAYEQRSQAAPV